MARNGPAPSMPALSKTDADFQAEDDFRTLQRAEEVRGDKKRIAAAMKKGEKQVSEMQQVLSSRRARRQRDGT